MSIAPMFSAENEFCVIGSLLRDNDTIDFIGALTAEHFFLADCRTLFSAAVRMIRNGHGCDAVTLAESLPNRNDGDNWLMVIGEMVANTPNSRNIARYAQIVIDRSTDRALSAASSLIASIAVLQIPTADKVDQAQTAVMALADGLPTKEARNISSILSDVVQAVQDGMEGNTVRALTGWTDIDSRADLLTPGDFIVLAARPAMGKTAMAMNLAAHVAVDKPVVVFSQEMGDTQLATRLIAAVGRVPLDKLLRNQDQITKAELDQMSMAADKISRMKLHIDDQPARSLHQIRTYCRAVKRKYGELGLIVIDYLQLMQGDGDSRHEEIASISRGLKVLAKELHVTVLALSQLSRKCEERNNRRPQMSDIRESGQIEQDADVIAFIYRDEVYNPQTQDKGIAEIIFGKLRNGQIGTSALAFNGEFSSFNNLFRAWEPAPPQQKETRTRGFA